MDDDEYEPDDYDYEPEYDEEYEDYDMEVNPISVMTSLLMEGKGTGFVLCMSHPSKNGGSKDFSFHPRFNQPCQGGELRKYEKTHPGECTQPHNDKPFDLYNPFPSGRPEMVGFYNVNSKTDATDALYHAVVTSNDSPWLKGFGGESNIETVMKNNHVYGFIIKRLNVDPTVMVNGVNFINTFKGYSASFVSLRNAGLDTNEALMVMMLNGKAGFSSSLGYTWDYRFPTRFSARRFFDKNPDDVSGGLYEDGADYNRTFVQDVFASKEGLVWYDEIKKLLGKTSNISFEEIVPAVKTFIQKGLEKEPIIETRYVYRNAMGQELPYPEYAIKINPSLAITKENAA